MSYWCIFNGHKSGTVTIDASHIKFEGDWEEYNTLIREEVVNEAERVTGYRPVEIYAIPYPAYPQLNQSNIPSFCHGKEQCWGKSSCPREHSCVD